ncbi:cobalt-precorrin-6A reductase [Nocardia bovistercoris]|uniref:Cobalt-precorrin-6A reductase n=1 Tax=Nocardia bovistercoris TaxID=2785916 RepID=A0A931N5G9_9NOCA|nr:cobalt-precorrin-6A reductase [Nocardia bovistercoris]MBH0779707.1 cobalt-precorrin-6A reductase [Nocardia bovistercoris]
MRILILGGTREARELARLTSGERGFEIVSSLAGRVRDPLLPEGQVRIGGFGGVDGLVSYLADTAVDVVVDATHPFAARIGANAAAATSALGVPLLRVRRPGWTEVPGDRWIRVPDPTAAARAIPDLGERVFLTIGRQGVAAFAELSHPWFLIRSIDPPAGPLPPRHELLCARGPFSVDEEMVLFSRRRIDLLVTKDSGGDQTEAKLLAARVAGVPVLMIDRPALAPGVRAVRAVEAAVDWLRDQRDSRPGSLSNQSRTARS